MYQSSFMPYFRKLALLTIIGCCSIYANAQSAFKGLENLFDTPENYVVYHVDHPPVIDGNINEQVWQQVNWTKEFVDIEGRDKPKPPLATKVKMLWDDSCLYIAAQLTEPQIWASIKKHDAVVFQDNDFEFFIDPSGSTQPYYEVEVNPFNTIWDLLLTRAYRDGGTSVSSWDVPNLKSAVKIQGTLNNPSDKDEGWTVEMAIPIKALIVNSRSQHLQDSTIWRVNFSRVEWDTKVVDGKNVKLTDDKGRPLPEHNWSWSPQGLIAMHYPERWGYIQFSKQPVNSVTFNMPYAEEQKKYLWLIYYRQKQWLNEHKAYATSLHDLGIDDHISINNKENTLKLEATNHQFMGFIKNSEGKEVWAIDQAGWVQKNPDRRYE